MDSLKAGYAKLVRSTERVGGKVMRRAMDTQAGAAHMLEKLAPGRQYCIAGRTVMEERQLGEGGFAFVWTARDVNTHEELALKKILCRDKEGLAMAKREVNLLERLPPHPNLVRYYGHTVSNEGSAKEVVLLFELCTGGHLLDLLERNQGVLSEDRILAVFLDVCTGVASLHAMKPPVQHRDIKVENVLLAPGGTFKLCDFGSWSDECGDPSELDAKAIAALKESIDRHTTMMYRPPEMVDLYQQFCISEKVDIWMLGCILYTLMFYRHPFQDESSLAISNARYDVPSTPQYSEKLQDLVHWLLAQDPSNRPTSKQLLDLLHQFKSGGPLPLPRSIRERLEKQRKLYGCRDDGSSAARAEAAEKELRRRRDHMTKLQCPSSSDTQRKKRKERKHKDTDAGAGAFWALPGADGSVDTWPAEPLPQPEQASAWAAFERPARLSPRANRPDKSPWQVCWDQPLGWQPSSGSGAPPPLVSEASRHQLIKSSSSQMLRSTTGELQPKAAEPQRSPRRNSVRSKTHNDLPVDPWPPPAWPPFDASCGASCSSPQAAPGSPWNGVPKWPAFDTPGLQLDTRQPTAQRACSSTSPRATDRCVSLGNVAPVQDPPWPSAAMESLKPQSPTRSQPPQGSAPPEAWDPWKLVVGGGEGADMVTLHRNVQTFHRAAMMQSSAQAAPVPVPPDPQRKRLTHARSSSAPQVQWQADIGSMQGVTSWSPSTWSPWDQDPRRADSTLGRNACEGTSGDPSQVIARRPHLLD